MFGEMKGVAHSYCNIHLNTDKSLVFKIIENVLMITEVTCRLLLNFWVGYSIVRSPTVSYFYVEICLDESPYKYLPCELLSWMAIVVCTDVEACCRIIPPGHVMFVFLFCIFFLITCVWACKSIQTL